MPGERDRYDDLIDPAERYQDFMLQIYDLWALAEEYGYSKEARGALNQARLMFMDEFQTRHPDAGSGRAIWRSKAGGAMPLPPPNLGTGRAG